jgi:phosphatidylglycerophosphatase A
MATPRNLGDRLALLLATGFGTGYAPVASGTFGSLPGLALAWALAAAGGEWALLAGALVVAGAGVVAADRAAAIFGEEDPGRVVVDEVAGQMVTLLFVPKTLPLLALGFLLFRALDVWKPWPARRLEDLPGGSGIMADDLAAGIYANLILQAVVLLAPASFTGVYGR